jgi:hypothetical protein
MPVEQLTLRHVDVETHHAVVLGRLARVYATYQPCWVAIVARMVTHSSTLS